jgi:hydroxymethylbilane synthase
VAARLRERHPDLEVEEVVIRTGGDGGTKALGALSDRGVFVKEIEEALLDGGIDLAVHSLKDLPTDLPHGLILAAVPERHDARDALLSVPGWTFDDLPRGARVATGSFRRKCQLLHRRPDLEVVSVRGNVDTRIRKLREEQFDALVLALAGVERLGLDTVPVRPIPESVCLPAVGQAALGIETREDDAGTRDLLGPLVHAPTQAAVTAERAFLQRLGGGCLAPATGYATEEDGRLRLEAVVGDPDGTRILRDSESGGADEATELGERLADRLLDAGAGEILAAIRDGAGEEDGA